MFFEAGIAARNGLTAAQLAALGAYGSEKALDGEAGLLTAYRPDHKAPDVRLFDGEPEIMSVFFKPVPVCNFAQTPCLAAVALAKDKSFDPSEIVSVEVQRVTRRQGLSRLRLSRPLRARPPGEDEHSLRGRERAHARLGRRNELSQAR